MSPLFWGVMHRFLYTAIIVAFMWLFIVWAL